MKKADAHSCVCVVLSPEYVLPKEYAQMGIILHKQSFSRIIIQSNNAAVPLRFGLILVCEKPTGAPKKEISITNLAIASCRLLVF